MALNNKHLREGEIVYKLRDIRRQFAISANARWNANYRAGNFLGLYDNNAHVAENSQFPRYVMK